MDKHGQTHGQTWTNMDNYKFDFTNQALIKNGVYARCRHIACRIACYLETLITSAIDWDAFDKRWEKGRVCFGTRHAGEQPDLTAEVR